MSELDELRQKRLRQLQGMQQQGSQQAFQQQIQAQQMEEQINLIMHQIMSAEARERLANIRMARPEFARQVEMLLIQLYQGGRLKQLTDEQFKALLTKISGSKREPKINVR
ncbi:MAG: DNA-binding protein [Candidatus Altiarchaeota archaeon]